jgi:hypothetical protein
MAIDTSITRIPLAPFTDLETAIKDQCDLEAARDKPRKLITAFSTPTQVVLIFQSVT